MTDEVEGSVYKLFIAYASGEMTMAQFMIRIRKVKQYCIEKGIVAPVQPTIQTPQP